MTNYLNDTTKSRGVRNNNPGNLRRTNDAWKGKIPFSQSKDQSFEQFIEMRFGIRAMMIDLIGDIAEGKNTVSKVLHEFAPAFENNVAAYIGTVTRLVGIGIDQVIDLDQDMLVKLCKAIVAVENGKDAKFVLEKDYTDALAILGRPLKKKAAKCPHCGQALPL